MLKQELIDRLVIAVEQQDVLYCLVWLSEMKEKKPLNLVDSKHSWKTCSALASIVQNEFNESGKIIMELLLLSGADSRSEEVMDLAVKARSLEAMVMLLNWERVGEGEANDARRLLEMPLEEAADWIDSHLPQPPNPDLLTGDGPLPSRPSTVTIPVPHPITPTTDAPPSPPAAPVVKLVETVESKVSRPSTVPNALQTILAANASQPPPCISSLSYLSGSSEDEMEFSTPSPELPSTPLLPLSPPRRMSSSSSIDDSWTPATSRAPSPELETKPLSIDHSFPNDPEPKEEAIPKPVIGIKGCATLPTKPAEDPVVAPTHSSATLSRGEPSRQVRLKVVDFPQWFEKSDLVELFSDFDVVCEVIKLNNEVNRNYAFVSVDPMDVERCLEFVRSRGIRCHEVATSNGKKRESAESKQLARPSTLKKPTHSFDKRFRPPRNVGDRFGAQREREPSPPPYLRRRYDTDTDFAVVRLVVEEVVLVHSVHRHGVGGVDRLPSITPPREVLHLRLDLVTLTNVKDHLLVQGLALDQDLAKTMNHRGIKDGDYSEQLINNKHSWKGYSALESIIQSPFSQLRRFILELLLLCGADGQSDEIQKLAMQKENLEALRILLTWNMDGRNAAIVSAQLLNCDIQDAAIWIDSNLPQAPNFANLTGCGPLPTEQRDFKPEAEEGELSSQIGVLENGRTDRISFTLPRFPVKPSLSPSFTPISSSPPVESSTGMYTRPSDSETVYTDSYTHNRTPPTSSIERSSQDDSWTRLHLGRLPLGTRPQEIETLFEEIGVVGRVDRHSRDKDLDHFVFVVVHSSRVSYCIDQLDGYRLGYRRITCTVARPADKSFEQTTSSHHDNSQPCRSSFDPPSPLQLSTSRSSTSPPQTFLSPYNLLILNLPLLETSQALNFLEKFPRCKVHQLQSHNQAVAFIGVNSQFDADYIVDRYDGCWISGDRISIVRVREGLGAEEAVTEYFGRADELDVDEGSARKKRRFH
ncbi:hypothetical protein JCM5353_007349 [Sporobolomyces roseus]